MDSNTAVNTPQQAALNRARYNINLGKNGLDFQALSLEDPIPTGRQILNAAGIAKEEDYSLFAILPSGEFEDVRLDETFDLQGKGAERFIAFQTDRDFKLTIDGNQLEWGKPIISGTELYKLAKPGEEQALFLEVRGGEDHLIEREELIDLSEPGIERFITALKPAPDFHVVVNGRPYIITEQTITFEQVLALAGMTPNPEIIYEMTFKHAAGKPHSGSLNEGGSVKVKRNGTIFNVTATIRS